MNRNYSEVVAELQKLSYHTQKTFGTLTAEEINRKPSHGGWSIGQCFEHLILSNNGLLKSFTDAADKPNSFWENYSPLSTFFGNYLINYNKNDTKKVKTPTKTIVPPSEVNADIISKFVENNRKVSDEIRKLKNVDWKKRIVTSPFLSVITYRLGDGIKILIEHEKRHIRQAEKVLQTI